MAHLAVAINWFSNRILGRQQARIVSSRVVEKSAIRLTNELPEISERHHILSLVPASDLIAA